MASKAPIIRHSARVLIIDEHDRVLLLNGLDENLDAPSFWVPPGGGLEQGETYERAAVRELREECGLSDVSLQACVWHRSLIFRFGTQFIDSREQYFVCRVVGLYISGHVNPDEAERRLTVGHRWWSAEEIVASDEFFVPRDLGRMLPPLLHGDYPPEPLKLQA
jgi:ADP-ribose pyrophosphatase YjhB (NUDIX family)